MLGILSYKEEGRMSPKVFKIMINFSHFQNIFRSVFDICQRLLQQEYARAYFFCSILLTMNYLCKSLPSEFIYEAKVILNLLLFLLTFLISNTAIFTAIE